ncbi:hypothetical protein [Streptomyces sp. NPDC059909]|uniref:hypothetical protein n=1 Tax=Streptomyces sp. NPDC059909 TaxID=3346998 RepID=UPI00364BA7BE
MQNDDAPGTAIRVLAMLVLLGSRDHIVDEYRCLLEHAGFIENRTLHGETGIRLPEAGPSGVASTISDLIPHSGDGPHIKIT